MRLKMLKTAQGSENGYQVNNYLEGEVYDVRDAVLAQYFVDTKNAEEVSDEVTKRIVDNAGKPDNGSLAPSELARIKADEEAGIARPATERLVEVSEDNQVDVEAEKAEKAKAAKRVAVNRQKEELDATLNEPVEGDVEDKALKGADYENKAKKGK